jgi:hypothetical protein
MRRLLSLAILALVAATPAFAQSPRVRNTSFASDFQTIPVMANVPGANGANFQTYVALLNPTASSFAVTASLFDATGTRHDAQINLAPGELKTYTNFLSDVFNYTGGGAVTFNTPDTAGGTRNNRIIVDTEVRTSGTRYGTSIPALEFAGSPSRSFAAGVTVDANNRTNIGCFNQSNAANKVTATVLDASGKQTIGTVTLNLAAHGWGQAPVTAIVSGGYVQFDPQDSAVCYAVVVDNATNDGRFIPAAEYTP